MTENILKAFEEDIKYRIYGSEPINNVGWQVNSHEITEEGVVYEDINVKVEAFPVAMALGPMLEALILPFYNEIINDIDI